MNELGNISISSDVVATIAESVITEIEGIYSLAGSAPKNEITKFFQSRSKLPKVFKIFLKIFKLSKLQISVIQP